MSNLDPNKASAPTERIADLARAAAHQLAPLLRTRRGTVVIRPDVKHPEHEVVVPVQAFELFVEILGHMAAGKAVTVMPINHELSTQEAADVINVSRPHLIKLLEEGKIPYRTVGTHRRVRFEDLKRYRDDDDQRRKKVIDQLAADAQADGLDD